MGHFAPFFSKKGVVLMKILTFCYPYMVEEVEIPDGLNQEEISIFLKTSLKSANIERLIDWVVLPQK